METTILREHSPEEVRFEMRLTPEETRQITLLSQREGRPLCIVVPVTDWKALPARFFWFVRLSPSSENGLSKDSGADCFQVKSLSTHRCIRRLGKVTDKQLENIVCAIVLCIGHKPEK